MSIYPDNVKRFDRMQQLMTHISVKQLDLQNFGNDLENTQDALHVAVNQLLARGIVKSEDEVIQSVSKQLSEEDQKKFQKFMSPSNDDHNLSSLLLIVGAAAFGGGLLASEACIMAIAFRNIQQIRQAAQAAGMNVQLNLQLINDAIELARNPQIQFPQNPAQGFVVPPVGRAERFVRGLGVFFKTVAVFGFGAVVAGVIIKAVKGAEQKKKLIETIHDAQVSRLVMDQTARTVPSKIQVTKAALTHAKAMLNGNEDIISHTKEAFIEAIQEDLGGDEPALDVLQTSWEEFDKNSGQALYQDDDLPTSEVVQQAKDLLKERAQ